MTTTPEKCKIRVPDDTTLFYSEKKKIITIVGPLKQKSLKIQVKLEFLVFKKQIIVTKIPISEISNKKKKKIKTTQGTTIALIKQLLVETSTILNQKIKFVGVGYRAFKIINYKKLFMFKLGYSHLIYFNVPENLKFFCLKFTKMFILGSSYQQITQLAALIQCCRKPDPYKGKGVLYENQKIILKEGKKV
jgi:large subunit ribosomal protein L6